MQTNSALIIGVTKLDIGLSIKRTLYPAHLDLDHPTTLTNLITLTTWTTLGVRTSVPMRQSSCHHILFVS